MLKASIIGNLGADPELQYSQDGKPRLRFNVATNGRVRNPAGAWEDKTEWLRVTVFGARADSLSQYLKKSTKVYVDGRLEARPWTDSRGEIQAGLEVIGDTIEFMSSRQGGDGQPSAAPAGNVRRRPVEDRDGGLEDLPF